MSADGLERVWFLNTLVLVRVPPERGTDGLCVMEHHAPNGDSPPLHIHHDQDEVFTLLAGEARFHLSGRDIEARTGDWLIVPKGEPHSYLPTSAEGVRFLTITRGDGFVGLVREAGRAANADGLPELSPPPSHEERRHWRASRESMASNSWARRCAEGGSWLRACVAPPAPRAPTRRGLRSPPGGRRW